MRTILRFATGGLQPDLTLLLDVDVEEGLNRRKVGGGEWNRLDAQQLAFHKRVRGGYLHMSAAEPARWKVINASNAPDKVETDIRAVVLQKLEGHQQ